MNPQQERKLQIARRHFFKECGVGLGKIALASLLTDAFASAGAAAQSAPRGGDAATALLPRAPHFAPKAKRVIHLFMNGGPFQGDFIDPKPALNQFAGQRPKEVNFRTENATGGCMAVPYKFEPRGQCGLPVSELLPLTTCASSVRCTPTIQITGPRCS